MLVRPALREYRSWVHDSRRWQHYRPREGDVVVCTYPKCGTTWMQRIVNLLIFRSPEPRPVSKLSPWYEMRVFAPVEALNETLEAQTHRRTVKTHLPLDGLPIFDEVRYIHVARDGRDTCLSFHHHLRSLTADTLVRFDKAGLEDPGIGRPFPPVPADPADYFHLWLTRSELDGFNDGYQNLPFLQFQATCWAERDRPNLLMVHYADLKRDLAGEMRRVADFLGIDIDEDLWPSLVEAASFETMKRQGDDLMPMFNAVFEGGSRSFFHHGQNERWRGVFRDADLALYEAKVRDTLPPDCALWLEHGRLATGMA